MSAPMTKTGRATRSDAIDLADIRAAAKRIEGFVRRTPMIAAPPVKTPPGYAGPLNLKLESLQVTGSFKPRGAINTLRSLSQGRATFTMTFDHYEPVPQMVAQEIQAKYA